MLQKWKTILANWVECYTKGSQKKRCPITLESLVNIISHLQESFNLDESTSTLDAQTIEEFILEKYPEFRFEIGNLEPANEEEIYIAASLLLYFVCVNSKDVDIKKAMCNELSSADQEIILKYSKRLMDCNNISSTDVMAAISEACGQVSVATAAGHASVAETPPALRSLHTEVRRLQAALDAERFDRNYLQEELVRNNLKIEKLIKDKEQYKQDIVNLKAKLSTCGQDTCVQDAEVSMNSSVKLVKELEQAEQRLVTVQEKLDDVQYERDMYKKKLDELKRERDKWIATSQEETSRVCKLAEELEMERKQVHSLRELVSELRQHNRLNGVDTSQLECDDPDSSARSLHNASACSEACAVFIEVQLEEERAKIVILEQQIKHLQDQLNGLTIKSGEEIQNLTKIISDKEDDIFNLKHRINEEIEERFNLKLRYDDEVTRLNNEVTELEQRIKGNGENSRRIIDSKMKEIQILQEEKLSLLQSLTNETTKLENVILKLQSDLDVEKSLRLKMREEYENKVMKLNEKVLNRNNELVELQNKICEKGETMEKLQFDLRKEKESKGEVVKKYSNDLSDLNNQIQAYEDKLGQKNNEITNLNENIQKCNVYNQQMERDIENLSFCLAKYKEDNKDLEDCRAKLLSDLQKSDLMMKNIQKEYERLQNEYTEEKKILQYNLDETKATVEALRNQLQNEIDYKISVQKELHDLQCKYTEIEKQTMFLNQQGNMFRTRFQETEETLIREMQIGTELKNTCDELNKTVGLLNKNNFEKEAKIKVLEESLAEINIQFEEQNREKDEVIDMLNNKLTTEITNLQLLEKNVSLLKTEKGDLLKDISDKHNIIVNLQNEIEKLTHKNKEYDNTIEDLKNTINEKSKEYEYIKNNFDAEISILLTKLNDKDKILKELRTKSNNTIQAKELQIETLKIEIEKSHISLQKERDKSWMIEKEKLVLLQQLDEANIYKAKCEKEYLNKCTLLNSVSVQLNDEISRKNSEISYLKNLLENLAKSNEERVGVIKNLEQDLQIQKQNQEKLINDFESERLVLKSMVTVTESVMEDQKVSLSKLIAEHTKTNQMLEEEVSQLKKNFETERKDAEIKLQDKEQAFKAIFKELSNMRKEKGIIENEMGSQKQLLEQKVAKLMEEVSEKRSRIEILTAENEEIREKLKEKCEGIISLEEQNNEWKIKSDTMEVEFGDKVKKLQDDLDICTKCKNELEFLLKNKQKENTELLDSINKSKIEIANLEKEKMIIENEKTNLCNEIVKLNARLEKREKEYYMLLTQSNNEIAELKKANEDMVSNFTELDKKLQLEVQKLEEQAKEKVNLTNKCSILEDYQAKAEAELESRQKEINYLENEVKSLRTKIDQESSELDCITENLKQEMDATIKDLYSQLISEKQCLRDATTQLELKESELQEVKKRLNELQQNEGAVNILKNENEKLLRAIGQRDTCIISLEQQNNEWKIKSDTMEVEFGDKVKKLQDDLDICTKCKDELKFLLKNKQKENTELLDSINKSKIEIANLEKEKMIIENEKTNLCNEIVKLNARLEKREKEYYMLLTQSNNEIAELKKANEDMVSNFTELDKKLQLEVQKLEEQSKEKVNLTNKCSILEDYQAKAEAELESRQKEINYLENEVKSLRTKIDQESSELDSITENLKQEMDATIKDLYSQLISEKQCLRDATTQLELKESELQEVRKRLNELQQNEGAVNILKNENEKLLRAIGQRDTYAVASHENSSPQYPRQEPRDPHQVDTISTDHSSMESYKTISDLEKIIQDKNRTITTLQTEIMYLKSLVAESENKYLDIAKDSEMSKENCQQLSGQLKKIVHQKNEEIADLKKQITKMSATENRASQIIKVSAKYQAIILKRIAEIKSNTVLKELTNFGNTNCDSDLRKSLTAGTITMEDLENFLETTERHIRRCTEKQVALQKERDRLYEVNRINESEIINMRKFLTELSVSIKTFNSVKELYTQKLSRVVSIQRTVRREILSLDGRISDAVMGKLERGYSAVMQDLSECTMNLERWMERCVSRTISSEKIKQAFTTDIDRVSLSSGSFQNTGLEIQLEELQNSFQKLLEEVARAQKGEARDAQSETVMEVRAEYEDKLNRMKAKMKQLYQEQITIFKEKQNEEILSLKEELIQTRSKLQKCEEHIKSLTAELWRVGEKYLMQKDEADWLKKAQRSGSLMSLQHVHSSGLVPPGERGRPSDTHSLRSLPVNSKTNTKEGRGLHMYDEEGEVFDNRWLQELATTPRRDSEVPPGHRISELRYRNSLCPPHLKSSYPAETQFAPAIQEEEIKCLGTTGMSLGGRQRKEVGITAYKKPGPPTPSKQAGRLSATDSELRESLRVEADPSASRKTSTPSRLRLLFRSNKTDTTEGTPRSRRLSNMFRKK